MDKSQDLGMTKRDPPDTNQNEISAPEGYVAEKPESVSIKMPQPSPVNSKKVAFNDDVIVVENNNQQNPRDITFHCQSMPSSHRHDKVGVSKETQTLPVSNPSKLKDNRYKSFKTFAGKPDRKLPLWKSVKFHAKLLKAPPSDPHHEGVRQTLSADRYFDALQGPELDTLKPSEELMLPKDQQWPFLLRFPISTFGVCLGVGSQAILWKNLATNNSMAFLNISLTVNLVLWFLALAVFTIVSSMYILKIIIYFEAVRREYYHPIRINFFFAPWVALLFLAIGVPPSIMKELPKFLWYVLMAPLFCLELKIYGQWMSGGQRRLSKVANPSNHLSVVGNFVGALLGASMGLQEGPLFFFAVGLAHYTVLFVTLYQRLPTAKTLPKELHPVFFLFVAGPSVASMAWGKINGSFDFGARIMYFIALFLYFSLAVRVNFFRGIKFSLAWWAYTFPMTGAAIATIKYTNEVTNAFSKTLTLTLSSVASVTVICLFVSTIFHAFVSQDLFPNDIGIAISSTKAKTQWKWPSNANDSAQSIQSGNSNENKSSEPSN